MNLDLASLTFLVVEDSAYMRAILRTMLQGFGARRIVEAEDGARRLVWVAVWSDVEVRGRFADLVAAHPDAFGAPVSIELVDVDGRPATMLHVGGRVDATVEVVDTGS